MNYYVDETFSQKDFTKETINEAEYENCIFINCDFNSTDLSNMKFINCEFIESNLSNAKLNDTSFQEAIFKACKMIGFNLENSNQFGLRVSFNNCILNDSSFYNLKLKRTIFKNCSLQFVDFTDTDLSNSLFDNCNFDHAIFYNTNLRQVDLRSSNNFIINTTENQLKGAKIAKENLIGLVQHLGIKVEE